jgi:hypothetical protein
MKGSISMPDERTITIQGMSHEQAVSQLSGEMAEGVEEDVERAVVKFTEKSYRSFRGEYTNVAGDLTIHFFLPAEAGDLKTATPSQVRYWEAYWLQKFPDTLSQVAREYFQADKPRLVAKYTEELASWWFCARGFGDSLSLSMLAEKFFERLDASLAGSN